MTSWTDFEQAEPELARRARGIISATTNCVLATIRADGSPRASGIDPFFRDGDLWIGSMPDSRKGADLARDPRIALHGIPWESRKVKDGAEDPGDGDVKITGRAVKLGDSEASARILSEYFAEIGVDEPEEGGDLYTIDLATVVVISVADDQLVVDRWSAVDGRKVVKRS
ncbi:pyridoxamine 5'-phosphate oxidase family protein [Aquihabitans daechungensis]|uniref:pyridoxamine 5'-phosphate oxidase family protein n=1 Tax=Aquihabitans daechungensis TaxID=1052257 RepID=UPI003BA003EE